MKLIEKQALFATLVARLILRAGDLGFAPTLAEAYRSPQEQDRLFREGRTRARAGTSAHQLRLALDLNLFRDGRLLTSTKDHLPLGTWWEAQHPLCRWGGRWGDGNHYSMQHGKIQ